MMWHYLKILENSLQYTLLEIPVTHSSILRKQIGGPLEAVGALNGKFMAIMGGSTGHISFGYMQH